MKSILMKKFGPILGLVALMGIIIGFTFAPASCSLTPEQAKRLQTITVPVTAIGLNLAQSRGLIEPGDKITLTQGVAIVVSDKQPDAKIFELAMLGLEHAVSSGLLGNGDVITVKDDKSATILSPPGPLNPLPPPAPKQ